MSSPMPQDIMYPSPHLYLWCINKSMLTLQLAQGLTSRFQGWQHSLLWQEEDFYMGSYYTDVKIQL